MPDDQMPSLQPPAPPPQALTGSPEQTPQPSTVNNTGGPLGEAALGALKETAKQVNQPEPAVEPTSDPATGMVFNAPGESTPNITNVKVFSPTGELGDIPSNRVEEALKNGGKLAIPMIAPNGKDQGFIPQDHYQDALKSGGKYDDGYKDARRIAAIAGGMAAGTVLAGPVATAVGGGILGSIAGGAAAGATQNIVQNAGEGENPFRVANLPTLAAETGIGAVAGPALHGIAKIPAGFKAIAEHFNPEIEGLPELDESFYQKLFKPRPDVPKFQHGEASPIEFPMDRNTVNNLPQGKNLTDAGAEKLMEYTGNTGPVGSSPKNMLYKSVEPVQNAIKETGMEMNKVIEAAPEFKTSVLDDATLTHPDATHEPHILDELKAIRENLPLKNDDPLNKVIDKEWEAAQDAVNSKDPHEVLAYRRKLGSQINWSEIYQNPDPAREVQNLTRVKIYHALGNKIHAEIPETVDLDKVFQPNLELRDFQEHVLGKAVANNPVEANALHTSEFKKGQAVVATAKHNAVAANNRRFAGNALKAMGYLGAGALGAEGLRQLTTP